MLISGWPDVERRKGADCGSIVLRRGCAAVCPGRHAVRSDLTWSCWQGRWVERVGVELGSRARQWSIPPVSQLLDLENPRARGNLRKPRNETRFLWLTPRWKGLIFEWRIDRRTPAQEMQWFAVV